MSLGIIFDSDTGAETLAAAALAKFCQADPALRLESPPGSTLGARKERVADMMLWVAIINATVGGIHLARFIYDVIQQRKVEVSIVAEDGRTYKIKSSMSAEQIEEIVSGVGSHQ